MPRAKKKNELGKELTYSKSNKIINAKGKSPAMGLKLFDIGIRNLKVNEDGSLTSVITLSELRRIFRTNSGSFYTQVKEIIKPTSDRKASILDWRIYKQDDANQRIEGINVITNATFENGELRLEYNKSITNDIYNLQGDYTVLSIDQVVRLTSSYSIKLYEVFKSEIDKERAITGNNGPIYYITYDYQELRKLIGVIPVKASRGERSNEPFKVYSDFRKRVLDRATAEINEITSLHEDYEPVKVAHGAVRAIRFAVSRKDNADGKILVLDEPGQLSEAEKKAIVLEVLYILDGDFTLNDVRSICDSAHYSVALVREKYEMLCRQKQKILNRTGWLKTACEKNFTCNPQEQKFPAETENSLEDLESQADKIGGRKIARKSEEVSGNAAGKKKADKKNAGRNSWTPEEQAEYDFEQMEMKLVTN